MGRHLLTYPTAWFFGRFLAVTLISTDNHVPQELRAALDAKAAAAAAADAELHTLRARAEDAAAAEAAAAALSRENGSLKRQLEEVMLSHDAAVQSKDRALAQV